MVGWMGGGYCDGMLYRLFLYGRVRQRRLLVTENEFTRGIQAAVTSYALNTRTVKILTVSTHPLVRMWKILTVSAYLPASMWIMWTRNLLWMIWSSMFQSVHLLQHHQETTLLRNWSERLNDWDSNFDISKGCTISSLPVSDDSWHLIKYVVWNWQQQGLHLQSNSDHLSNITEVILAFTKIIFVSYLCVLFSVFVDLYVHLWYHYPGRFYCRNDYCRYTIDMFAGFLSVMVAMEHVIILKMEVPQ